MQFTTHILLSNKSVVGSWTLPTDAAVAEIPSHSTWVEEDQLYVNIYRTGDGITGLHQFQETIGKAISKWLKPQVPDISTNHIGWQDGELLVAGLRYPELTESSWAQMPAYVVDSVKEDITPLWLSQFGIVVERSALTRGNRIECVCDDKVAEIHGRYGSLMHHHGSVDRPREFLETMLRTVLGRHHGFTPLPGTPIYTGCQTPFQYQMQLSRTALRKELNK